MSLVELLAICLVISLGFFSMFSVKCQLGFFLVFVWSGYCHMPIHKYTCTVCLYMSLSG